MDGSIGYLLAQLCKGHRNAVNSALDEVGLHVGQEMLLGRLWQEDGISQSDLAGQLCIEAPTATRMLQRMESHQLIERRSDPDDARLSRVYLTDKSRALREPVEAAWQRVEARLTANLSLEERLLLRRLLQQMLTNLES